MGEFNELVERQRAFFHTGVTKTTDFRLDALSKLREGIKNNETKLVEALRADLNKSEFEAYITEIGNALHDTRFTMKHLHRWAKPRKVKTPMSHLGASSHIYPQPYGTTLIIAPWNYPFSLAVSPLIGAIAAGNCSVVKPSEYAPNTSRAIADLINVLYPQEYIAVIEGGVNTSQALLAERFDLLFFTGSAAVGKMVMQAAAQHLTPVVLELGGKSPCIVHEDARLKLAAKRIAWGKFTNAGQTCVAPDYIYVHQRVKEEFINHLREAIKSLYGDTPLTNTRYCRIINEKHFQRLVAYLANGRTVIGGKFAQETLTIEPTALTDVSWDDPIMQEEIFGPILPILAYNGLPEVIAGIRRHPNPLALYVFSESRSIQDTLIEGVSFGGGCVNDTILHVASPHLPFGGVGHSGMGSYHGKASFQTFSHEKSILRQTTRFDPAIRYPNTKNGLRQVKLFLR